MNASRAIAERWDRLASADSEQVSLAEGALLIAAQEYENLDIDDYLRRIEEMGEALRRRLRVDIATTDALVALNHYVFEELGFRGNTDDYYDPRNSFLNDVIDRKLGIPITLAVLYIEIGRRIGLPLSGVSFPAHFLVKCTLREGAIILDPYTRGASLGIDDLKERLKDIADEADLGPEAISAMLATAEPREVLARMLRNLRAIYQNRGERVKALGACDRIIGLVPDIAQEYLARAELYGELECARAAVSDYEAYLRLNPLAGDGKAVRAQIAKLAPMAARLH